jgi:HEXXH motif-containing protein
MSARASYSFAPDSARARRLDQELRVRLAASLEHVADKCRGLSSVNDGKLRDLTTALRGNLRFPPTTFALYYDIVDAILENRLDDAERCLASIANEKPIHQPLSIVPMDNATLGADMVERYGRMMDTDPATPHVFAAPSSDDVESCRAILAKSLRLMERGCPQTYGEFAELVDQIVLCNGTNLASKEAFLAGSSFTLWGALFINPSVERTARSLVETLAHEASHTYLFGIQISDGLVLNPDEERFPSPLRTDPRPMDGVYHATFVSARMHFAMKELLDSGLMPASDVRFIDEAAERDLATFKEGLKTVRKFGRLTHAGQEVMAAAEDYMAAQAA